MKILRKSNFDVEYAEKFITDKMVVEALREKFILELYEEDSDFYIVLKEPK